VRPLTSENAELGGNDCHSSTAEKAASIVVD
jgi:hypothetical protein